MSSRSFKVGDILTGVDAPGENSVTGLNHGKLVRVVSIEDTDMNLEPIDTWYYSDGKQKISKENLFFKGWNPRSSIIWKLATEIMIERTINEVLDEQ